MVGLWVRELALSQDRRAGWHDPGCRHAGGPDGPGRGRLYSVFTEYEAGTSGITTTGSMRCTSGTGRPGLPGGIVGGVVGAWIGSCRVGLPRAHRGRGRARAGVRAGDWPLGQLVQPAALRPSDHAALGGGDLARAPAGRAIGTSPPSSRCFSYESVWDALVGVLVIYAARRFLLTGDRTFVVQLARAVRHRQVLDRGDAG